MEPTNDSTTTSTEQVEETGAEGKTEQNSSNDLSAVLSKLEEFGNDIASLKRTAKKVSKTEKSETPEKTKGNSFNEEQVESLFFQVNQITKDSEKKLVRDLQNETGMTLPKLLESRYFKAELEGLRTNEANAEASSGIKGDKSGGGVGKQSAQYWIAKGEYPTRDQVPDRKVRGEIRNALASKLKGTTGGFYNS